jgi:hypothetical protein
VGVKLCVRQFWEAGKLLIGKLMAKMDSDPAGIRTQDPILKRDVLYLLSYRIGFLKALQI